MLFKGSSLNENENDLADKMIEFSNDISRIFEMGSNGRKYVSEHFNRNKIAADFIKELQNN